MVNLKELQQIIECADNIVFFGGAGVSTESGIPDFRSQDGLFNQQYDYPPEEIVSRSFFEQQPQEFYRFYLDKMISPQAQPNKAHLALAYLEQLGKLKAVVTQNIDGLHQAAGSQEVIELHGSVLRNYCLRCGAKFDLQYLKDALKAADNNGVPRCSCPGCEGIVRPDVVLYQEPLDEDVINQALQFISGAEVLIIGGTSLVVYPAAGFIQHFRGNKLVIINKQETPGDNYADMVIRQPIGEVLGAVVSKSD